ncbi:MAG TPA: hypothetical protein DEW35_05245 [Ruminococcaceae bacterium]|nr:hypothetical protein [Oscillospiraceae bacterium]
MKNKYYNKKENRRCSCCRYGTVSEFIDEVFCRKKGLTDKNDCCIHFKYDVLKRVPGSQTPKNDFKPSDFKID